jgi:acetyl esterase
MMRIHAVAILLFAVAILLFAVSLQAEDLKDIEYARAGKEILRFDAHIPDGPGPFPAAILVHGGAWVTGDRVTNVEPLFAPLAKGGFAWFSISYRLAGDVLRDPVGTAMRFGAEENDVRSAVAFVKDHAAEYRVNPDKIALIGASAGGQLASMAALKPDPGGSVAAVVAFYSPSDLASLARTSTLIPQSIRDAVTGTLYGDLLMAGLTAFSPIHHVSASAPPFLLIHGSDDDIVPIAQSEKFCGALRDAGASCELYRVDGAGHGIGNWQAQRLTDYQPHMIHWLKQILDR